MHAKGPRENNGREVGETIRNINHQPITHQMMATCATWLNEATCSRDVSSFNHLLFTNHLDALSLTVISLHILALDACPLALECLPPTLFAAKLDACRRPCH